MRLAVHTFMVALLAGCAGSTPQAQNALLPAAGSAATGTLQLRVHAAIEPHFVSPSTKAIDVTIDGPTKYHKVAALRLTATGCHSSITTFECTLVIHGLAFCKTPTNCYSATVATYDAYDSATKRIPPGAHVLSRDEKFAFAIRSANQLVPLALEGIPHAIAFIPAPSTSLVGSQNAGFVEPKCSASAQSVNVVALDADRNYIVGAGAPEIAVRSSTPSQLAVQRASGNTFSLVPPAAPNYAYGNFTTHLALTATPGKKSASKPIATTVNVSYSGQICGTIQEFTVPTAASRPAEIATGPDGNLWFTEEGGDKVGRISIGGTIAEFPLPTASANPIGIAAGSDGALWVAETNANKIAKVATAGSVTEYPVPTASSDPLDLAAGPNGNVWFTELQANKIGEISDGGLIEEFVVPSGTGPSGIAQGPDGNMWFTGTSSGKIGQITPTGSVATFAIPNGGSGQPIGIASVAGALWFTECTRNYIGRITTAGTVVPQYLLPEPTSKPAFGTAGPDGSFWFTEATGNRIGTISPSGTFTEYGVPTITALPYGITVGPDGAIWFTENNGDKIGRLR